MKNNIYVYGHKNPDSDSICSAIGTAYLKNKMVEEAKVDSLKHFGLYEEGTYVPRAAGELGDETKAILDTFKVTYPQVVKDIRRQMEDLKLKEVDNVYLHTSIKKALELMEEKDENTLFVTEEGQLKGIITYKDIARVYMDLSDSISLGEAGTSYQNVLEVIQGEYLNPPVDSLLKPGQIKIMEASNSLADKAINKDDIVILSADEEKIKFLIDKGVSTIVVSNGGKLSDSLKEAFREALVVISSPYDIYDIARLIKQAIPVSSFMVKKDDVVMFTSNQYIDDVQDIIKNSNFREFPVVDMNDAPLGVIDKAAVLSKAGKRVVMVDHNEKNQAVVGIHQADVIEIIDHHKLSTVETNKPINVTTKQVGCTATIVFNMFENAGIAPPKDIAGVLCGAIISDTMHFKSPTCTDDDILAAKELAQISGVPTEVLWKTMLDASLNVEDKTDAEILYQDYKKFNSGGFSFGIGQVLVADEEGAIALAKRMKPFMEEEYKDCDVDLMGLLITDVERDGSELVFLGESGKGILESAFNKDIVDNQVFLDGVVSRKKQIVPQILTVLEQ